MAQAYINGATTVTTAATLITNVPAGVGANVLVQNNGSAAIFLGGPSVATSGANQGFSLAAGASILLPASGSDVHALYGIVAAATQPATFIYAV